MGCRLEQIQWNFPKARHAAAAEGPELSEECRAEQRRLVECICKLNGLANSGRKGRQDREFARCV